MIKILPRLLSARRYLSMMDPIYKWKIKRYRCLYCGGNFFIQLRNNIKESDKCISQLGFSLRCLKCKANLTNSSLIKAIKKHISLYDVKTAWEMSTYGVTLEYLLKNINKVFTSEYFEGKESGSYFNDILIQDVQKTSFKDNQLDLITCNQVFEHVPDLNKSFSECYRILNKNGALIFSVPFFKIENTEKKAYLSEEGINYIGKPEFHDSRIGGPGSAPVFWHISINDIEKKLSEFGFQTELIHVGPNNQSFTQVIYARKLN